MSPLYGVDRRIGKRAVEQIYTARRTSFDEAVATAMEAVAEAQVEVSQEEDTETSSRASRSRTREDSRADWAGPIEVLANRLQFLDRLVIDATGLRGNYEWAIGYAFTLTPDPSERWPSIFVAMEEQLGIRLEPRTAAYEVLVVDSVQTPTPN